MLAINPSSAAPASTGDKWKIVFDQGTDLPYNYSASFRPKIWLYNQADIPVSSGVTVSYSYVNVNTGGTISSGTATSNGDGSYTGGTINMPSNDKNYINIKFSVPQNSNIISEQHVVFAGTVEASKGAIWKIVPFNTSSGPSWDRNQKQNIYIILYSDARTPIKNQQEQPTITIKNSAGTVVNSSSMTYLDNGIYNYTLPASSITSDGEYYFEITSRWSSRKVTGGKSRYTTAIAGFNIEAVGNQGDESPPDLLNWKQTPNFPTPIDNVTLSAEVFDNVNVSSVTTYYSVNNGTIQTIPVENGMFTYRGIISRYLMEDHIRYWISASDGINMKNSSINDYVVTEPAGSPNTSFSYMNHPVYYFGYSRAGTANDAGGDTGYDGTWTSGEKDGVYYMQANPQVYTFFRDMTTIKIKTMILDSKGKPVRGLKNVKAWLQENKTQPSGARNANKTMTEVEGEDGIYIAAWEGSPAMSGTSVTWNDDAKVIWGKYDSGQIYSAYVDFNNDSVADENITWLAYTFMDTFVGSSQDGKGLHGSNIEASNNCGRACHQGMVGSTSRVDAEPTCPDCHGVEKTANGGSWPISGNTDATDRILYGNSSSHSRLNTSGNSTYCGDESCHNSLWGATPVNPAPIPGYNPGDPLENMFNNSGYPVPAQCGECHTYKNGTIPSVDGHNAMINCKFCHGSYHRQHRITDYITSPVKDDVIRGTPGYVGTGGENGSGNYAGNCYKDCHKTQVEHSLVGRQGNPVNEIVPCDECHKNFDKASMHLDDVGPYDDRDTCGGCHQVNETITHNVSYSMNPPVVTDPVRHSENIIGNKWNRTGTRPFWSEYENSCRFCHGRSYNDAYGLGRNLDHMGTNSINGTINSTSYWCASCHVDTYRSGNTTFDDMVKTYNDSFGVVPPEITGNATWKSDRNGYIDHQAREFTDRNNSSTFSDDICYECHGRLANSTSMTVFMHNVDLGQARGAGPDCISCHDTGKTESGYHINNTAMSTGVHANLNTNATNTSWVPAANKKCWGCHDSNGTQPSNTSKGSRFDNPYKCYECHNSTNKPYASVSNAPNVSEHFKGGTSIRAATAATDNSSSCIVCHNITEMKVTYSEDDIYNSNYSFPSHYGKKRTDLRIWDSGKSANCSYCHQNSSTAFSGAMVNEAHTSIQNHTNASSPTCYNSTCHNTGWIHNSSLAKPDMTLPNTTFCQNCHADKQKHNNIQDCSNCHINTSSSDTIHPIKFIQTTGTYDTTITQAANCTDCHQAELPGFTAAPIIPATLKHSSNISNGTIWGIFWTSGSDSCYYCHSNTKHNATALGRINALNNSNNIRNGNLNTTGWCADCHYNASFNTNYIGDQWNPIPPLITFNNAGKSGWVDHSDFLNSGYNDSNCRTCHALNGPYGATTLNYSHSFDAGTSGGVNCTSCHNIGGSAKHDVDIASMNNGAHASLNNRSQFTGGNATNRKCWACHGTLNSNGFANEIDQPATSHNTTIYQNPRDCPDCHNNLQSNSNFSAPQVAEHREGAPFVPTTGTGCSLCHNNSLTVINENDGFGITNPREAAASHYLNDANINLMTANNHSNDCRWCHILNNASQDWGTPFDPAGSSKYVHTSQNVAQNSNCYLCHGDLSLSVKLHDPGITGGSAGDNCIGCHTNDTLPYPAIDLTSFTNHRNVNLTNGTGNLDNNDCTTCHYNSTNMTRVLTRSCEDCHTSGNYNATVISNHKQGGANITTAAYCSGCHNNSVSQYKYSQNASVSHYGTRTGLIPTADCTNCHKDPANASLWGNATDPAHSGTFPHSIANTPGEDCYACHNSAADFHNVSISKPSVSSVTCLDCHKTTAIMAHKKIDSGVIASGSHKDRACENCHANATDNNMDSYSFTTDPAKTCTDCHTGSGNFSAPLVAEHNQEAQQILTLAACTTCHSNGGMYFSNTGTNGTGSAITHYIKDVTNTSTSPYQHNGPINTSNCIDCHNGAYTNNSSWGSPVNITTSSKRIHIETLTDQCDQCHKDSTVSSLSLVDFHNASVQTISMDNCLSCHDTGGQYNTRVDSASLGMHGNINNTDGGITNADCATCHYDTTDMGSNYTVQAGVNVRVCNDCHMNQNVTSPMVSEHYPGANINVTTMNCENCHSNSLNIPNPNSSVNTAMGNVTHYGTTTDLITPSAGAYNTACNNCHNSAVNKTGYGVVNKQVTVPHTGAGTCNECHVDGSASDLHNSSLGMPVTVSCIACHTTYASKYNSSNLTGTPMDDYSTCGGGNCHGTDISGSLDTLARHNVSRTFAGTGGSTNTVYLNNNILLTITKGTPVEITSMINDANGAASRVGGAEYYLDVDPGRGKGIPMSAADGLYDATRGNWENVIATLDTGNLSDGNHTIFVRGVDIGKQWSTPKNATLVVQSLGYINVTVTSVDGPVVNADVWIDSEDIKKTDINGSYLFAVPAGTYNVTVSKQPTHNDNTSTGVVVTQGNTTPLPVYLQKKPTGTISGTVTDA